MSFKHVVIITCALIFNFSLVFTQNITINKDVEQKLNSTSIDSLITIIYNDYGIDELKIAFDIAVKMANEKVGTKTHQKGVNILAILAKSFTEKIKNRRIKLDNPKAKQLLLDLESEKYIIEKPKVSRFLKLVNYLCIGDYAYVHKRLMLTKIYKVFLSGLVAYLLVFILSFFNRFKWRYKKGFKKFTIIILIFVSIISITFNYTCKTCIGEYSFYGIDIYT